MEIGSVLTVAASLFSRDSIEDNNHPHRQIINLKTLGPSGPNAPIIPSMAALEQLISRPSTDITWDTLQFMAQGLNSGVGDSIMEVEKPRTVSDLQNSLQLKCLKQEVPVQENPSPLLSQKNSHREKEEEEEEDLPSNYPLLAEKCEEKGYQLQISEDYCSMRRSRPHPNFEFVIKEFDKRI
ncbi:hypothetical protein VNO77_02142 [Canavalia gladiata]|uniref:Uncharacterized protein n=1 Tax=Canavalia gladiata TaxID=3824 RepID=A0AAN9MT28_CANGL